MNSYAIELARKERDQFLERKMLGTSNIPPEKNMEKTVAESNEQILSWQELVTQEIEDGEWIIDGLIRPGWLCALGGHGKHGKTTLGIHILNALRLGKEFITSCQRVPVMYLNYEMSPYDLQDLVKDVTSDTISDGETATIINFPSYPLDIDWLEDILLKQDQPGMCLIDSFRAAFALREDQENQSGVVGSILRHLSRVARKTSWTIMIIQHSKKSGTGEMQDLAGSAEWYGAPDVVFTWHRPKEFEPGTFTARGRIPPFEPLSIDLQRKAFMVKGTVNSYGVESQYKKILESLTNEWTEGEELCSINTDIPDATVRRRLRELETSGKVEKKGNGVKGDPHMWRKKEEQSS